MATAPIRAHLDARRDFQVFGDGSDETDKLQLAFDTAAAEGYALRVPAGDYLSGGLAYASGLEIFGDGRGRSRILQHPDFAGSLLSGGPLGAGYVVATDFTCRDLTFDGNNSNSLVTSTGSLMHAYRAHRVVLERVTLQNSQGYGIGFEDIQTDSSQQKRGPITDATFYDVHLLNNGWSPTGVSTSADGIDVKYAQRLSFIRCYAFGNSDKGFNPRARYLSMVACVAENNGSGYAIGPIDTIATTTTLSADITATATTVPVASTAHLPLEGVITIGGEDIYYAAISGNNLTGCVRGYSYGAAATHSSGATVTCENTDTYATVTACGAEGNDAGGFSAYNGTTADAYVDFNACHARRNGGSGFNAQAATSTGKIYVRIEGGTANQNGQHGMSVQTVAAFSARGTLCRGNVTDGVRLDAQAGARLDVDARDNGGSGIRTINACTNIDPGGSVLSGNSSTPLAGSGYAATRFVRGALQTVTAAAALTLPPNRPVLQVNGATGITSIVATWDGDQVTLRFTNTLTVTDGSNLKLNGNLSATPDTTLTLVCDGTNWIEQSRSVN